MAQCKQTHVAVLALDKIGRGRGGRLVRIRTIHGDPEDVLVAFWLDIQKSKALKIGLQTTKESSPLFVSNFLAPRSLEPGFHRISDASSSYKDTLYLVSAMDGRIWVLTPKISAAE